MAFLGGDFYLPHLLDLLLDAMLWSRRSPLVLQCAVASEEPKCADSGGGDVGHAFAVSQPFGCEAQRAEFVEMQMIYGGIGPKGFVGVEHEHEAAEQTEKTLKGARRHCGGEKPCAAEEPPELGSVRVHPLSILQEACLKVVARAACGLYSKCLQLLCRMAIWCCEGVCICQCECVCS